jgi:hypothetical protein
MGCPLLPLQPQMVTGGVCEVLRKKGTIVVSCPGRCPNHLWLPPLSAVIQPESQALRLRIQPEDGLGIIRSPTMPYKYTIRAMQQLAERRSGRCVSDIYLGAHRLKKE